jgi:hypothetical protein
MDPMRFDQLAKVFADSSSRRATIRRLGAAIVAAAVGAGLPVGRALGQGDPVAAQTCGGDWQGPLVNLPPGTIALGGDCQVHALGCRDFDADGICTQSYLTADCQVVEGGECPCPPPQPVCGPDSTFEQDGDLGSQEARDCTREEKKCYEDCQNECVSGGVPPGQCRRLCCRECRCCPASPPPPPPPGPYWDSLTGKCSNRTEGIAVYSAVLRNIPAGADWADTCFNTPGTQPPVEGRKPRRCPQRGVQYGEWDVQDESCSTHKCRGDCVPGPYSCAGWLEWYTCWCPSPIDPHISCPDTNASWFVGTCNQCYTTTCGDQIGGFKLPRPCP